VAESEWNPRGDRRFLSGLRSFADDVDCLDAVPKKAGERSSHDQDRVHGKAVVECRQNGRHAHHRRTTHGLGASVVDRTGIRAASDAIGPFSARHSSQTDERSAREDRR
jgi:hypothetical protein